MGVMGDVQGILSRIVGVMGGIQDTVSRIIYD